MSTITTHEAATVVPETGTWPPRTRLVVGAACLPGLFLAMLATGPLDPFDDSAKASVQLGQLHGRVGEVRALGWVELLAAALAIGVVLAFAGLTRARGRGLGNAGVVLGALGAVGMVLVGVHHWVIAAASSLPAAAGGRLVDRLDTVAGPGVLPLFMAMPVALVLLALAGWRAGFVPAPALGLVGVFFLGELVPLLPGGELVPLLVGLIGYAWIAVSVVRADR